jgi:cellulose synthase/poly-beta-1,6-N-acetylglucosamine synthase-like glycosyltransferase
MCGRVGLRRQRPAPVNLWKNTMLEVIFWVCLIGAAYSYFLYPAILLLAPPRRWPQGPAPATHRPQSVAVIVAARNESAKIAQKLENTLALERGTAELEILVASDASDDGMDDIVRAHAERGVRLIRAPDRNGKEFAQGLAIAATTADILVFTDAGTVLAPDAIANLLRIFSEPTIGAVSSVDRFISQDGSVHGEGLYVRYEMWLREREARFFSLVGLSGSFFAARREICTDWDTRVPSDFGTALNCARLGMRAVSDRSVIGYYKNIANPSKEYQRKVRTVTRGIMGLRRRSEVLNPFRFGRFSFEVFSHKVMRWAVPWFLAGAFCTCLLLAPRYELYRWLAAAQIVFYLVPLLNRTIPSLMRISLVRLCAFFIEVNVAIAHATLLAFSGKSMLTWEPSKR